MPDKAVAELIREFKKFHYAHRGAVILDAWLRLSFNALAQRGAGVAPEAKAAMEADYMAEIGQWTDRDDRMRFASMLGILACALATDTRDILGPLAGELEVLNPGSGQFFTPWEVCRLMAAMSNQPAPDGKPFARVMEPAAGSGAMVLAMANLHRSEGKDPCTAAHYTLIDIDLRCVRMSYIQAHLSGIAATVHHGNALTGQVWGTWHTPGLWHLQAAHERYLRDEYAIANVRKRTRSPAKKEQA